MTGLNNNIDFSPEIIKLGLDDLIHMKIAFRTWWISRISEVSINFDRKMILNYGVNICRNASEWKKELTGHNMIINYMIFFSSSYKKKHFTSWILTLTHNKD